MTDHVLAVPEVHCGHCIMSIEGAVAALDGVENVTVDLASKEVSVRFDDARVSLDTIVETIEAEGYDVGESGNGFLQIGGRP